MALRFSTQVRNEVASGASWEESLANGRLFVYSGTQPANANTAATGTLLVTFTLSGATYTAPVATVANIVLAGTSGSLDAISVGGASAVTGIDILGGAITNPGTAAGLVTLAVAQINANQNFLGIVASDGAGDSIDLSVPIQQGNAFASMNIHAAGTTTTTNVNAAGAGIASTLGGNTPTAAGSAAANGLNFLKVVAGVLAKEATAWQGTAVATNTAGWFRYCAGGYDPSATDAVCIDGSIATSGGDLTLSNLTITSGAVQTINTFSFTVPAS